MALAQGVDGRYFQSKSRSVAYATPDEPRDNSVASVDEVGDCFRFVGVPGLAHSRKPAHDQLPTHVWLQSLQHAEALEGAHDHIPGSHRSRRASMSPAFHASKAAFTTSTFSCDIHSLRQPRGCEGLGAVVVVAHTRPLSRRATSQTAATRSSSTRSAASGPSVKAHGHDHVILGLDEVLGGHPVVIPSRPTTHEWPRRFGQALGRRAARP